MAISFEASSTFEKSSCEDTVIGTHEGDYIKEGANA